MNQNRLLRAKKSFSLSFFFAHLLSNLCPAGAYAQTFNGQGGLPIPPGAPVQTVGITTSIATVSGIGILGQGCMHIENVTIDLVHTFVGDIAIFVIAPSGQVLELSSGNGGAGDNFTNSVFTDNTSLFITQGSPPYTGIWRPEGRQQSTVPPFPNGNPLGTFTFANTFNGVNADGDWTLLINDYVAIDVGTLNSWSITFSNTGGSGVEVNLGPDITICPGQSTTLTAVANPAPDSYAWNTGETTSSITVNPSVNTTYSVTVNDNGCIDADTINVIVNAGNLTANAGPDVSICLGSSTTLMGSGGSTGASYNWSSGQSGQNITVNPAGTTTYTLTITDGGCTATDQVTVTVTPAPIVDAGLPETICAGETTTLTATGGTQNNQYFWSTGQNNQTIVVSPAVTTTYMVTVSINGCIGTDEVEITVEPLPIVDAGPTISICAGESATLTANGSGGTYVWSTGQTGDEIIVTPGITTTYTVTVTDNGCSSSDQVTVQVVDVTAVVTPDQSICAGEAIVLTAGGGTSYLWSTGATSSSINVSPVSTALYTVTVSQNNCSDVAQVEIEVVPVPVATAGPQTTICNGQSVMLTAGGGTVYAWSTGANTPEITVTPGISTTYTVTVTDQGCSTSAAVSITVNPAPDITAGADVDLCDGQGVTLVASGLTGPGEYAWSTGDLGPETDVMPLITTTYTVTATNELGCTDSDEVTVNVHPVPVAQAGPDVAICAGSTVNLIASGGSGQATYTWSTGQMGNTISFEPVVTATYVVTVTDLGCTASDDVEVIVLDPPVVSAGPDQSICSGTALTLNGTGVGQYLWSTGETTSSISVNPVNTTSYILTLTNADGCSAIDSLMVTVLPLPLADAGPDQVICEGQQATLTGTGGALYQWSTGDNISSILISPVSTTTYSLTVTDANNCTAIDVTMVTVNPLPSANAGPNVFIVGGGTATLTATGGGTYQWSTGETTASISVSPSATTVYTVTVTLNGCSAVDDVTVFVNEAPSVDLGPDLVICEGESVTIDATIQGPFTTGYAWSTGDLSPSIVVSPANTTAYSVTVTDLLSGIVSVDTITVTVHTLPLSNGVIQGLSSLCENELSVYFTDPVNGATQYQWVVSAGGSIVAGQGTTSITVQWSLAAAQQVQLIASNDCGSAPAMVLGVLISGPPLLAGPVQGNSSPCVNETSLFSIPAIPGATGYTWSLSGGGTFAGGQGTNTVSVDWNGSPGGDICVVAENTCGVSQPVCVTVMTTPLPVLNAGVDTSACGTSIQLTGSGSGTWRQLSGPGQSSFADPASPTSWLEVTTVGQYQYVWSQDSNGCVSADTLQLVFDPIPDIINLVETCSQDHTTYTVSFDILGGTMPYFVDLHLLPGSSYTSMPIPAGSSYGFQVFDVNGCLTSEYIGQQDCACTKSAGTMDLTALEACADQTIQAAYLGGAMPDPGDTLLFVLHDGNFPDGIIAWSDKPGFGFMAPMEVDSVYFIAAVVGARDLQGVPDLADPCLAVSTATPVVFHEVPTVSLGPDTLIHIGESILITASASPGVEAFDWFGADPCTTCPAIQVSPLVRTVYQVEAATAEGCTASDQIIVSVRAAGELPFPNIITPNNDQVNDVLLIPSATAILEVEQFDIFDRWGSQVFHDDHFLPGDPGHGWNGTFQGKEVNPGVFTCLAKIKMVDGHVRVFAWDVTVLR